MDEGDLKGRVQWLARGRVRHDLVINLLIKCEGEGAHHWNFVAEPTLTVDSGDLTHTT